MKTILAIDDQGFSLAKIEEALENDYNVITTSSVERMFAILQKKIPDIIMLDLEMPKISGFEALEQLKADPQYCKIPVVFLTGKTDELSEERGLKMGAVDFITKPFSASVLQHRIKMHIDMDLMVRQRTEQLKEKEREIRKIRNGIARTLSGVVENRDKVTGRHIQRTNLYTAILIKELRKRGVYAVSLSEWNISSIVEAASMHDIGKIAISDLILNKPDKLTDEEFEQMKKHAEKGVEIIEWIIKSTGVKDSFLENAKLFAGHHHEKWDGSGYPIGLKGEDISLQGRIMAVSDVYDALVSNRPYKKAFSHEEAVDIIMQSSGKHFDPKIAEVFFEINGKFNKVRKKLGE